MYKAYLHGACDESSLMFKFRSGTHRLNEELGRHRGRDRRKEYLLCDNECESVREKCYCSNKESMILT